MIYEGDKGRRERIQLGAAAAVPPPSASTSMVPAVPAPETPATTGSPSSELGTQKIVGLTLGGAGVVGVGVGSVLGLLTISAWSSVKNACGPGGTTSCAASNPSTVTSDHNTAQTDGTISTVAVIAGGVLFATGLVVFLTGGHHGHEESPAVAVVPSVGPGQAGVALIGAF
jgi:serine/threonine-protein kinase